MVHPGAGMWMGSETELGIAGGWSGRKARAIQQAVVGRHPCLPSDRTGVFLECGARVYVDQGKQNEYATPEVDSPRELVLRELAGRLLMTEAAASVGLELLCANQDPVNRTAWGTHENYSCRHDLSVAGMIPLFTHLATRILYTGAGGRDPWSANPAPVLSPRACHTRAAFSRQGTLRKSLVFWKPDQYGSAQRLHVTSGESLLSQTAAYLKYATTGLVVAALDNGLPLPDLRFAISPVRALRRINRDTSLSIRLPMADGRRLSALEIQRVLLEALGRHREALPGWAPEALQFWAEALEDLEHATPRALRRLDWTLFSQLLREDAPDLFSATAGGLGDVRLSAAGTATFDDAAAFSDAIYFRLRTLGPDSLFGLLDRAGCLEHALPGITASGIRAATVTPPAGRAEHRAALIRRRAEFPEATLSWSELEDGLNNRRLSVPFTAAEGWDSNWRPMPSLRELPPSRPVTVLLSAERAFFSGRYPETLDSFQHVLAEHRDDISLCQLETLALAAARCGQVPLMEDLVARYHARNSSRLESIALELACRVHTGFTPPVSRLLPLVTEGLPLADAEPRSDYHRMVFLQYAGWVLAADGRLDAAGDMLREQLLEHQGDGRVRMPARTRCYLGEVLRRQGRIGEARQLAREARQVHTGRSMSGDLAMHSLPLSARLAGPGDDAAGVLALAEDAARETANDPALARVLCLKARCLRTNADQAAITRLLNTQPALSGCPGAARILAHWEEWISGPGPLPGDAPGDYWGL